MIEYTKLNINYVSDVIGEEYKKWRGGDVIKIKTQTGSGKTYFIKNVLIPYIDELNDLKITEEMKILLLTNRVGLSRQTKKDLLVKYKMEIPTKESELDEIKKIKSTTVMSYQALNEMLMYDIDYNLEVYDYIICDEIQYIFDDSWTGQTEKIFSKLIKKENNKSIRIFISATMKQLDNTINIASKNRVFNYDTNKDYSYLLPHSYSKQEQIIDRIIEDESKDKWIIFVSSITKGNELLKQLKSLGISAVFTYSGCKNKESKKEYNNIMMNEKFKCKVLITTKLLDNGINIIDDEVRNIVVNSWEEVNLIQSVGRVRFKDIKNAYKINLFLDKKNKKQFIAKFKSIEKELSYFELLISDKKEFTIKYSNKLNQLPNGIHIKEGTFIYDKITYANLLKKKNEFTKFVNELNPEQFIETQLSWLGLKTKVIDLDEIQEKHNKDKIKDYIESLINKPLDKQQQEELIKIIGLKDNRNRLQKSYSTINAYLQSNYNLYIEKSRIQINKERVVKWTIKNIN